MGNNGMNVNGAKYSKAQSTPPTTPEKFEREQKIIIDFNNRDSSGDLRIDMNELVTPEMQAYLEGKFTLPEGMTIADYLKDIQDNALMYDTTGDGKLNIDEFTAMMRDKIDENEDNSQGQKPVNTYMEVNETSNGVYVEWKEADNNGNVISQGASYSPRAEAHQNDVEEMNAMKNAAMAADNTNANMQNNIFEWAEAAHKQVDVQRAEVINAIINDPNIPAEQKNAIIAAQEATFINMHQNIESQVQQQVATDTAINIAAQTGYQAGFEAGIQAGAQIAQAAPNQAQITATTPTEPTYPNKPDKLY